MPKVKPKQEFWWEQGEDAADEEAERTIVLQLGSMYLRLGRVSDEDPVTVLHCIARKIQHNQLPVQSTTDSASPTSTTTHRDTLFRTIGKEVEDSESFKQGLSQVKALLPVPSTKLYIASGNSDGAGVLDHQSLDVENDQQSLLSLESSEAKSSFTQQEQRSNVNGGTLPMEHATTACPLPDTLYDVEALESYPLFYHLFFPLRFGLLNLHDGIGGSATATLSNMLAIWEWALLEKLKLPRAQRQKMNILLAIPNFYNTSLIYNLCDTITNELGFGSFQVCTELACAACATPVYTACIVDIGATQTTVACCDDGYVMPETLVMTLLGGNDITALSSWLLATKLKSSFRYPLSVPRCILPNDLVKQQMCVLDWDLKQSLKVNVQFPSDSSSSQQRLRISVPNNLCLTPGCVLFFPHILNDALDHHHNSSNNCLSATLMRSNTLPVGEHSSEAVPGEDIDQYYNKLDEHVRSILGFPEPTPVELLSASSAARIGNAADGMVNASSDIDMIASTTDTPQKSLATTAGVPGRPKAGPLSATALASIDEVMNAVIAAAAGTEAETETETEAGNDENDDAVAAAAAADDNDDVEMPDDDIDDDNDDAAANLLGIAPDDEANTRESSTGAEAFPLNSQPNSIPSTPQPAAAAATTTASSLEYQCKTPVADLLTPVDELILWSLNQIESKEIKARCLKNIIVIGGGGYYLKGIEDVLQLRIQNALPKHISITVMVNPPDAPGELAAWQGAAVLASTPVCRNLWIKAEVWNKRKLSVLRENALFPILS